MKAIPDTARSPSGVVDDDEPVDDDVVEEAAGPASPSDTVSIPVPSSSDPPRRDSGDSTLLSAPIPADRYEVDLEDRVTALERSRRDLQRRVSALEESAARIEQVEAVKASAVTRSQLLFAIVLVLGASLTLALLVSLGD